MSIRWIRNILVDGQETSLQIFLGSRYIGDKSFVSINNGSEMWFKPEREDRDSIVEQGIGYLKKKLDGKDLRLINGEQFNWK